MFPRTLRLLAAVAWASLALAQGVGRMTVFSYGAPQGLPEGQVAALLQDRQGRYWAAADHGVYVGDGSVFLKTPCPEGGTRPQFQALAEDASGRLYAAGESGLFSMEGQAWTRRGQSLPPRAPQSPLGLHKDGAGNLWLLWGDRLFRIEAPDRFQETALPSPGATVLQARPTRAGLLAREGDRAWIREGETWRSLPSFAIHPGEEFRAPLVEDARGTLWTATFLRAFRLDPGAKAWTPVADATGNGGYAGGVWSPSPGEAWLVGNRTAFRLDRPEPRLENTPTFSVFSMRLLLRDREGCLWADRNGLYRVGGPWRVFYGEDGLPSAGIWQVQRDGNGALWLTSTDGVFTWRGTRWERVWKAGVHSQFAVGPDGCIWAVEVPSGRILRLEARRRTPVLLPPELQGVQGLRGISGAGHRIVVPARDGRIHFGRWEGEWRWTTQSAPVALGTLRSYADPKGHLHLTGLASGGAVLHSMDGGPWRPLPTAAGRAPTDIQLWEEGVLAIVQYAPPSLQTFTLQGDAWKPRQVFDLEEASPCTAAYGMGRLADDRCWVLTDHGVLEFNPLHPERARHFTSQEGLPMDDTNQFGLLVERDRIWVSTGAGLAVYDRRDEGRRPQVPGPVLLGVRVDEAPWGLGLEGPLPPGVRTLAFQMGVPSPTLKAHLRYQWRDLERGSGWQGFEGPTLSFLDPAPGPHRIEVRCLEPGGHASPTWAYTFRVRSPWWRRRWALALWSLGIVGAAWGVHRLRIRRIRRRNEELAALVRERTAALAASEARERSASQAKSAFLADMSHELRTPLNAMLLYSELIQQDAEAAGLKGIQQDCGRLLASGQHLLSLLNGILDLSKIEAGKMEVDPEEVRLHLLLEEVVETLRPLALKQRDALDLDLPDAPLILRTDGLKLKQVLLNLGGNAIKFTAGGRITFAARTEEDGVVLEVRDTGVGLTPEQVARLFQAYEQPLPSTSPGTGLGLTISKRFVELLGGRIEASSAPGHGTTFRIWLPEGEVTARPQP